MSSAFRIVSSMAAVWVILLIITSSLSTPKCAFSFWYTLICRLLQIVPPKRHPVF